MPFGEGKKGTRLADIDAGELRSTRAWCVEKGKFADVVVKIDEYLAYLAQAQKADAPITAETLDDLKVLIANAPTQAALNRIHDHARGLAEQKKLTDEHMDHIALLLGDRWAELPEGRAA